MALYDLHKETIGDKTYLIEWFELWQSSSFYRGEIYDITDGGKVLLIRIPKSEDHTKTPSCFIDKIEKEKERLLRLENASSSEPIVFVEKIDSLEHNTNLNNDKVDKETDFFKIFNVLLFNSLCKNKKWLK